MLDDNTRKIVEAEEHILGQGSRIYPQSIYRYLSVGDNLPSTLNGQTITHIRLLVDGKVETFKLSSAGLTGTVDAIDTTVQASTLTLDSVTSPVYSVGASFSDIATTAIYYDVIGLNDYVLSSSVHDIPTGYYDGMIVRFKPTTNTGSVTVQLGSQLPPKDVTTIDGVELFPTQLQGIVEMMFNASLDRFELVELGGGTGNIFESTNMTNLVITNGGAYLLDMYNGLNRTVTVPDNIVVDGTFSLCVRNFLGGGEKVTVNFSGGDYLKVKDSTDYTSLEITQPVTLNFQQVSEGVWSITDGVNTSTENADLTTRVTDIEDDLANNTSLAAALNSAVTLILPVTNQYLDGTEPANLITNASLDSVSVNTSLAITNPYSGYRVECHAEVYSSALGHWIDTGWLFNSGNGRGYGTQASQYVDNIYLVTGSDSIAVDRPSVGGGAHPRLNRSISTGAVRIWVYRKTF